MADYSIYKKVGNRGWLNGEYGWELIKRKSGTIYLDGEFTQEEQDDGRDLVDVDIYIFRSVQHSDDEGIEMGAKEEWFLYNTKVYIGEVHVFDFPDVNVFHHESVDEVDPNDWRIGGTYEETLV